MKTPDKKFVFFGGFLVLCLVFGVANAQRNHVTSKQVRAVQFIGANLAVIVDERYSNDDLKQKTFVYDQKLGGQTDVTGYAFRVSTDGSKLETEKRASKTQKDRKKIDREAQDWHNPDREWYLPQRVTIFGGRSYDLTLIGDVRPEYIRYRICHADSEDCMVTPQLPCDFRTISWVTPISLGAANAQLGLVAFCTDWPVGNRSHSSFYAITSSTGKWRLIEEFEATRADMRSLQANIYAGPATKDGAAFSLIKAVPSGYVIDNFSSDLLKLTSEEFPPVDRHPIFQAIETSIGYSDLALWVDGGIDSLPKGALALAIGSKKQVAFVERGAKGANRICTKFIGEPQSCSNESFAYAPRIELRQILSRDGPIQYLWIPAENPKGKLLINVMGGPVYAVDQPGAWSLNELSELGYDVAVPLLTAGTSRFAHLPAIDASSVSPRAAGEEIDFLVNYLTGEKSSKPIIVSGSAGAAFVSFVNKDLIAGYVLVSADCFPLETLASGQNFLLSNIMTRERIIQDGGVASRLLASRSNACEAIAESKKPIYGFWFEDDMTLGSRSARMSADLFGRRDNAKVMMLKGPAHSLDALGEQSKSMLNTALKFVELNAEASTRSK